MSIILTVCVRNLFGILLISSNMRVCIEDLNTFVRERERERERERGGGDVLDIRLISSDISVCMQGDSHTHVC